MMDATPRGAMLRSQSRRGAALIIGFEFFERLGFYATLSVLGLFLTAPPSRQGLGWGAVPALELVGAFTGLMYALPIVGGALADRVLGHTRAVIIGGVAMFLGYVLLTSVALLPAVLGVADAFERLTTPLAVWGGGWMLERVLARAYAAVTIAFWTALGLLVIGNALLKATLVVLLGDTVPADPAQRQTAYAYYYASINAGGLLAGIVAGSAAAGFGWPAAFGVPAGGLGLAVAAFVVIHSRWLPPARPFAVAVADVPLAFENASKLRIGVLIVFALLLTVFSICAFQLYGTMSLVLEDVVDRRLGTFVIPTPWFTSVYSAALIVAPPLVALVWRRLATRGREPDLLTKYALALACAMAAMLLMGAATAPSQTPPGWEVVALAVALLAVGEVVAWTSSYAFVYRFAPRRVGAAAMGGFYALTLGLGGYGAGALGRVAEATGLSPYYFALAVLAGATGILSATLLRSPISRWVARTGETLP